MKCEHEVFTQEAGIVCSKTLEIIQLKKELKDNSSYRNGELEQQLEDVDKDFWNLKKLFDKNVLQLKEAESVIDYYLPILEERLSCGAYARNYLNKYKIKE